MNFERLEITDVVLCQPNIFGDHRGYFAETFRQDKLDEFLGYDINFCQDNESKSSFGVLRGLHFQLPPFAQTKLVRVTKGEVLDVAVDIRKGSPTFGKYVSVILSEENKKQLLVPRGFAHGFVVLSEEATFVYKVDNYYNPNSDRGLIYNDSLIGIDWLLPKNQLKLSEKDINQPNLKSVDTFEFNVNLYE